MPHHRPHWRPILWAFLSLLAAACAGETVLPTGPGSLDSGDPDVDNPDLGNPVPPAGAGLVLPFTLEELRTGSIDRILHCSGPLFNPEEHDGYLDVFAETAPSMARFDMSLAPSPRFTPEEKLEPLRTLLETYSFEIPHLTLTLTQRLADGTGVGLDEEVAAGEFDGPISDIAEVVRDAAIPFFVRFGSEFNGFWNGYSPEHFPDAFRRVVDLFRDVGASNAIFNWNYKAWQGDPNSYMAFYPGDDFGEPDGQVATLFEARLVLCPIPHPISRFRVLVLAALRLPHRCSLQVRGFVSTMNLNQEPCTKASPS